MPVDDYVDYVDSADFVISVGDGADPEVFTPRASINKDRGLDFNSTVSAQMVANKTNPSAPAKTVRKVTATDWSLSGAGTLDVSELSAFAAWAASGVAKNVQVNAGSVTGALVYTGPVLLETLSVTGAGNGEHVQVSLKLSAADSGVATTHA
jgi:hypothetical protein